VNIASVGGKIAIPHLLPYTVGKFALVGFSDGLRAELRKTGILVTTVCPGLLRTGSARNATFKGQHKREYAWFAISDSLPLLSMSAERAARQILEACRRGSARLVIGTHTKGAVLLNELFPGAVATLAGLADRMLPAGSAEAGIHGHTGYDSQTGLSSSWLTKLSQQAAVENNELVRAQNQARL
jgi:short-subunit dehydrogenase